MIRRKLIEAIESYTEFYARAAPRPTYWFPVDRKNKAISAQSVGMAESETLSVLGSVRQQRPGPLLG